ncbi:MAG: phosphatidate cytidylyltransferase [Prevotellaceae bacterium]|jgi:phosphatidate cytidylyltransferase|nr:phosphatidate cytidylyltransferase [Prevotellaceae bacterium]
MSNFWQRTISGIVYVAVIVGAILLSVPYLFPVVFVALSALTACEFYKLINKKEGIKIYSFAPVIAVAVGFLLVERAYTMAIFDLSDLHSSSISLWAYTLVILFCAYWFFVLFTLLVELFKKGTKHIKNIGYTLLGQLYIAVPFALAAVIYHKEAIILLALFVIIWANDTFAYLVGSTFGKHRLCERISPKKSWEGFFGGLIGALAAGYVFSLFANTMNLWQWLFFALIVSIFGTLGDLAESMLKRATGVKDSGNIIPGHGGFLDRLDSFLFAVPAAVIYLCFI